MEPRAVQRYNHTLGTRKTIRKTRFFPSIYLQIMPGKRADSTGVDKNPPTEAPQVSTVVQVPVNIFRRTLQVIIGLTSTQVQVLVENGYDSQEFVLYWKFTSIKEWCQLKAKIPVRCGGVSYGDRKIKCLQSLALWVTDFTLQGKSIDLNNFKTDILADAIEESCLDFEDTKDGIG